MNNFIYICSPCRGDNNDNINNNIENAVTYCRQVFKLGYIPIAPHVYFTRFLDDSVPEERRAALDAGSKFLLRCAEVWVFGLDKPSEGMMADIALAIRSGIPVRDGFEEVAKNATVLRMRDLTEDERKELLENFSRKPIMGILKQGGRP